MFKAFFALPLLFTPLMVGSQSNSFANEGLITEQNERNNYSLTGISNSYLSKQEIRVYYEETKVIDEIKDDAFVSCTNLQRIMLSRSVLYVNDAAFIDTITELNYTGSKEQYDALGLTKKFVSLNFYACDEGFINYWYDNVRSNAEISICDMSKADFQALYALYSNLSLSERERVDKEKDIAGEKIGESMTVLINQFKTPQSSQPKNEWKQSGALTFIIIVAVIGMTSICVFFLLKTKQIIS